MLPVDALSSDSEDDGATGPLAGGGVLDIGFGKAFKIGDGGGGGQRPSDADPE